MSEAISGPLGGVPACRFAHAGYDFVLIFIFFSLLSSFFFLLSSSLFAAPDEGRAERR
jgi:hypothetical protein